MTIGIDKSLRARQTKSTSLILLILISVSTFPHYGVNSFSNVNIQQSSCTTTVRQVLQQQSRTRLQLSSKNVIESSSDKTKPVPLDTSYGDDENTKNTPALKAIADERREYELNVGKALDTLRTDYPKIFKSCPDFSIYHSNLEVKDPSGVTLHGINNYKNFFRVLRGIVSFFYCADKSSITFRLVYDWARNSIRVSWHAMLTPKAIYGGVRHPLYVDGISVYETDPHGIIIQHRVEQLMINDVPAALPNGIFHAINSEAQGIPVLGVEGPAIGYLPSSTQISAFSGEVATTSSKAFNQKSFEQKNIYRKKYGLKPLTPEEFLDVEAKTRILEQETQLRREQLTAASKQNQPRKKGLFSNLFSDTCESNWDCQRPEVCCDLLVKKMCCSSGQMVSNFGNGQMVAKPVLIPVPVRPDGTPGSTARY